MASLTSQNGSTAPADHSEHAGEPAAGPSGPLRCALLTVASTPWFIQLIRVSPGLALHIPSAASLGLSSLPNPCALEEGDAPDVVMFTSDWFKWLVTRHESRVDDVFERLRADSGALVGLDGYDLFALSMPPGGIDRADVVLKAQGLYRDRELYNYRVGPFFPGANWTEKREFRRTRFSDDELGKLRLSLPCFVATEPHIRGSVRELNEGRGSVARFAARLAEGAAHRVLPAVPLARGRRLKVHCVGALTHLQRLEVMEGLEGFGRPGRRGITGVQSFFHGAGALREPGKPVVEWEDSDIRVPPPEEDPRSGEGLPSRLVGDGAPLVAQDPDQDTVRVRIAADGLALQPLGRLAFLASMARADVILAPTGFGELTFRHAETMIAGRALVAQDLRHAETMFPFRDHENVVFCRPDFADLGECLTELESDRRLLEAVAREGRRDWRRWTENWPDLLSDGVTQPLRDAVAGRTR